MTANESFRNGFSHEVGPELAKLIPEEIISDESRLREHVDRALDFGLKSLAQATLGIETSFVEETFRSLAAGLEDVPQIHWDPSPPSCFSVWPRSFRTAFIMQTLSGSRLGIIPSRRLLSQAVGRYHKNL